MALCTSANQIEQKMEKLFQSSYAFMNISTDCVVTLATFPPEQSEGTHIRQIKDVFPLSRFFVKAQFIASSPIRMSLRLFEKRDGNSSSYYSPLFLHQHFSRVFNSGVR